MRKQWSYCSLALSHWYQIKCIKRVQLKSSMHKLKPSLQTHIHTPLYTYTKTHRHKLDISFDNTVFNQPFGAHSGMMGQCRYVDDNFDTYNTPHRIITWLAHYCVLIYCDYILTDFNQFLKAYFIATEDIMHFSSGSEIFYKDIWDQSSESTRKQNKMCPHSIVHIIISKNHVILRNPLE